MNGMAYAVIAAAWQNDISAAWVVISISLNLLATVIMFHGYYDISLFVPFFDISVSLGDLFQGIASIYDRFYFASLNKLFAEKKIFSPRARWP